MEAAEAAEVPEWAAEAGEDNRKSIKQKTDRNRKQASKKHPHDGMGAFYCVLYLLSHLVYGNS